MLNRYNICVTFIHEALLYQNDTHKKSRPKNGLFFLQYIAIEFIK